MEITGTPGEIYERHVLPATIARWTPDLVEVLSVQPGERVLDVACGTGIVTRLLPDRVGSTGRVVGLDVNGGMLAVARAVAAQTPIEWVEGNAMDMPLPDAAFDAVVCQQGLQFVPDKLAALHEMQGPQDFDSAFEAAHKGHAQALFQMGSPLFGTHRKTIVDLVAKSRLPTSCEQRVFVVEGCLMAYGPSFAEMWRRAATYVDKILEGASTADLPIEQSMKFELVVNLKTADALGLTIPPTILIQADEVIR